MLMYRFALPPSLEILPRSNECVFHARDCVHRSFDEPYFTWKSRKRTSLQRPVIVDTLLAGTEVALS